MTKPLKTLLAITTRNIIMSFLITLIDANLIVRNDKIVFKKEL